MIGYEIISDGFDAVDAFFAVVPWLLVIRQVCCDKTCNLWCS
jgi:hypothetical protein